MDVIVSVVSVVVVIIIGWTTIRFSFKDYRVRRKEAVLNTVLEIRTRYSEEWVANGGNHPRPDPQSIDGVQRSNLRRRLQANLACFKDENTYPLIRQLAYDDPEREWGWQFLQEVVVQAMEMMRHESKTLGAP